MQLCQVVWFYSQMCRLCRLMWVQVRDLWYQWALVAQVFPCPKTSSLNEEKTQVCCSVANADNEKMVALYVYGRLLYVNVQVPVVVTVLRRLSQYLPNRFTNQTLVTEWKVSCNSKYTGYWNLVMYCIRASLLSQVITRRRLPIWRDPFCSSGGDTRPLASSWAKPSKHHLQLGMYSTLQPCKHTLHAHACSTHTHTPHTYAPTHHICTHTHTHRYTHMHTSSDLSAETHRRCARRQPQAVSSMTSTAPLPKRGMFYKLMFQCHVHCVSVLVLDSVSAFDGLNH